MQRIRDKKKTDEIGSGSGKVTRCVWRLLAVLFGWFTGLRYLFYQDKLFKEIFQN